MSSSRRRIVRFSEKIQGMQTFSNCTVYLIIKLWDLYKKYNIGHHIGKMTHIIKISKSQNYIDLKSRENAI